MSQLGEFFFLLISFTLTIFFYTNKQLQVFKKTNQNYQTIQ